MLCILLSFIRYGGGPPRFGGGGGGGSRGGPPPGKFGNPGERLRKKHWNLDELPKFQKNFYQEHPDASRRPLVRPALNWMDLFSLILILVQNCVSVKNKRKTKRSPKTNISAQTFNCFSFFFMWACMYVYWAWSFFKLSFFNSSKRLNNTEEAKKLRSKAEIAPNQL